MSLKEYHNKINKDKCPRECDFQRKKDIKVALVPPPEEMIGVVISRDPTINWWQFYKYSKIEYLDDTLRKILFVSAIPYSLFNRILNFMGDRINEKDRKFLFKIMFQKIYWTHLHKCFTDKSEEKSFEFKPRNAYKCADCWLFEELNIAIDNKAKFIISLGNEVQNWIKKWKKNYGIDKTIEIIDIPHPSGQNRKWNDKGDRSILAAIDSLLNMYRKN